jgi:hypothetical protein
MKRVILIFGLLAGALISGFVIVMIGLWENSGVIFDSELLGYASMVIALSMVFFGIKSYRDNYQKGVIRFWKGVQIGALITLLASLMYTITWETYHRVNPAGYASFINKYCDSTINKKKAEGVSAAEIEQVVKRLQNMKKLMENPAIRFGMTLMEILPVGIIITLISAAVLRKKELLPA